MTEDDKALVERLRDEDEGGWVLTLCGEAADRIEALIAENERLNINGIHSCHDQCERPLCVVERENERLRGLLSRTIVMAETYAEGTGTQFNEAMAEARAALGETK